MHCKVNKWPSYMLRFATNCFIIPQAVLPVRGTVRSATEFLYLTLPVPYQQCYISENSGKSGVYFLKRLFISSIGIVDLPVKTFQLVLGDAENAIQCFTYELPGSR